MKIVVTGALGHIGSCLIRLLPQQFPNSEIVMIDDFSSGRPQALFDLPSSGLYTFHKADICCDPLEKIFEGASAVIHLAAWTHSTSPVSEARLHSINTEGAIRVAEFCIKNGARMIFPSTTSVFGKSGEQIPEDNQSSILPQTPYAESKRKTEIRLLEMASSRKLQVVIVRFGTVFGVSPGMQFHTAVNRICLEAACSNKISVWKTALDQLRPYCEVKDASRAILCLLAHAAFDGSIFHAATEQMTMGQILEIIKREVPGLPVECVEHPLMNEVSYTVSVEKIQRLGFVFSGSLQGGVQDTLLRFKSLLPRFQETASSAQTLA